MTDKCEWKWKKVTIFPHFFWIFFMSRWDIFILKWSNVKMKNDGNEDVGWIRIGSGFVHLCRYCAQNWWGWFWGHWSVTLKLLVNLISKYIKKHNKQETSCWECRTTSLTGSCFPHSCWLKRCRVSKVVETRTDVALKHKSIPILMASSL